MSSSTAPAVGSPNNDANEAEMVRRRRRLVPIVDARFQWKYTLLIAALGVGVTAIMGGFLYRAHVVNTRVLELVNEELRLQVARNDQLFLLYLVLLVVGMAFVLSIWGIIVTHRISGPLYLVARYLGILGGGQYPDMRPLRKRDELQEFFTTFEEAVNQLKARDQANLNLIESALQGATAAGADRAAAAQVLIDAMNKQKDLLTKMLKS